MTGTIATTQPDRWRTAVITVLIYGLAGPLLGVAVLMITVMVSFGFTAPDRPFDPSAMVTRLPAFMQMLLLSIPFSYMLGGIQAFAAGLLVSAYGLVIGKPGYLVAAVAGLVTFGGFVWLGPQRDLWEYGMMLFVHIIPALICWHIVKRFWNAPA